jgi:carboxypeptidase Q
MVILPRFFPIAALTLLTSIFLCSQPKDTSTARPYQDIATKIIVTGLGDRGAYRVLSELTSTVGARLSGSPQAAHAVEWGKTTMENLGFDRVHLEPVTVPHWVRGPVEEASIVTGSGRKIALNICALGGSIATPDDGITGEVIEVKSFEELKALGDKAKGKIVFFNRPMDATKVSTFEAYGGAVNQRGQGAVEAAKVGGIAALVRSMSTRTDNVPHTGAMGYVDSVAKVPAAAVSTIGANLLDSLLSADKIVRVRLKLSCRTLPDVESANVVGELTGSERPNEVIVIGGHLDSWDKGQGAHDDGAGVAETIEALRLIKLLGLHPRRTVRAVFFMNEENGLRGGKAYAAKERPGEKHIAAIETDAGGFSPRGFGVQSDSVTFDRVARWSYLLEPIDANWIRKGGGGADISPLGKLGVPMIGLRPDGQRYFDYHHSDSDTIDKVNERELELGAEAIAILVYTLAQEGL